MQLTFTYEYPLIVRTTSATAPTYELGSIVTRNTLQRARLSPDLQEISEELYEAAESLIRNENIPVQVQTKLYSVSPKLSQLTYEDALIHLSQPVKGENSLVGVTSTYEKYKEVDEVKLIRALAEESLLTKAVARGFDVRLLREAGVDLSQLFSADELEKFRISEEEATAALYRLSDGLYKIYDTIPMSIRGENVYVMGVEKDSVSGNLMTSVVPGREFDEYKFDYDEGDQFKVYIRICFRRENTRGKSWNEEQDSCIQQIKQNTDVCDATLSLDGGTGILSIENYHDKGFCTASHDVMAVSSIDDEINEIKGWYGLFQSIGGDDQHDILLSGAAPDYFEPYARWYVEEARARIKTKPEMKFADVINDQVLFQVLCGGLAYRLEMEHILREPFNCLATGKFDTLDYVESLYKLYCGIDNLLSNRLCLATKRTYIKKDEDHHINAVYAQWAGCQCFLQEKFTNFQFMDQFNDSIFYQFCNPASTDASPVRGGARNALASMITKYKNTEREERVSDVSDHLFGFYLHETKLAACVIVEGEDYEDAYISENKNEFIELDFSKSNAPFKYRLDSSFEFPDYTYINQYLETEAWNQTLRLVSEFKRFFEVAPTSMLLPDCEVVVSKVEFEQRIADNGYKMHEEQSDTDDNDEIEDIPKTYEQQMLEPEFGVEMDFGNDMIVVVPRQFVELLGVQNLHDFTSVSRDMVEKLGFTMEETALFIDLADATNNLSPFLMYDESIGHYYVPAFFNNYNTLLSKKYGFSAEQTAVLLTATVQQPPITFVEGEPNLTNIMTLIDLNQVFRKLAQTIREYKVGNYSCFEFMGKKVHNLLEQKQYLEVIQQSLQCFDSGILFYVPTNSEKQAIEAEQANLDAISGKSKEEIFKTKPLFVQDFYEEHEKVYQFAFDKFDQITEILNESALHLTEYVSTFDHYFAYYTGQGDKRVEHAAFCDFEVVQKRDISWGEMIKSVPPLPRTFSDFSANDLLLLSRIRGVEMSFLLRNGLISPDESRANIQKFNGFDSVSAIFKRFGYEYRKQPISLREMTGAPLSAPLFYRLTTLENLAQQPLKDVFGRVLRAASPYSMNCLNEVENVPAPLESEAPPPPSAAGEESTIEQVITFWRKFQQNHYNIDESTLKALLSPLFCLEQREFEEIPIDGPAARSCSEQDAELGQEKTNQIIACRCASAQYIMYPPNSTQIDSFMRGIYYMSPYYVPACQDSREELLEILQKTCNYAISVICQLIRDGLDKFLNMPPIAPQTRPPPAVFTEVVIGYFQAQCAPGTYEHIAAKQPPPQLFARRPIGPSHSREFDFREVEGSRLLETVTAKERFYANEKFSLSEYVKNGDFWGPQVTYQEQIAELTPLIELILQSHPILDILTYGEASDSRSAIALEVHRFLTLGKLGKAEDEQRVLEERLLHKMAARDEVHEQLLEMQHQLSEVEARNIDSCVYLSHRLQEERYSDLHDQICDLFATVVNASFARACSCDKKLHPEAKTSPDQQICGAFENGGPDPAKVSDWQNEELSELARRNGLSYGTYEWPVNSFSIEDIVDFGNL